MDVRVPILDFSWPRDCIHSSGAHSMRDPLYGLQMIVSVGQDQSKEHIQTTHHASARKARSGYRVYANVAVQPRKLDVDDREIVNVLEIRTNRLGCDPAIIISHN